MTENDKKIPEVEDFENSTEKTISPEKEGVEKSVEEIGEDILKRSSEVIDVGTESFIEEAKDQETPIGEEDIAEVKKQAEESKEEVKKRVSNVLQFKNPESQKERKTVALLSPEEVLRLEESILEKARESKTIPDLVDGYVSQRKHDFLYKNFGKINKELFRVEGKIEALIAESQGDTKYLPVESKHDLFALKNKKNELEGRIKNIKEEQERVSGLRNAFFERFINQSLENKIADLDLPEGGDNKKAIESLTSRIAFDLGELAMKELEEDEKFFKENSEDAISDKEYARKVTLALRNLRAEEAKARDIVEETAGLDEKPGSESVAHSEMEKSSPESSILEEDLEEKESVPKPTTTPFQQGPLIGSESFIQQGPLLSKDKEERAELQKDINANKAELNTNTLEQERASYLSSLLALEEASLGPKRDLSNKQLTKKMHSTWTKFGGGKKRREARDLLDNLVDAKGSFKERMAAVGPRDLTNENNVYYQALKNAFDARNTYNEAQGTYIQEQKDVLGQEKLTAELFQKLVIDEYHKETEYRLENLPEKKEGWGEWSLEKYRNLHTGWKVAGVVTAGTLWASLLPGAVALGSVAGATMITARTARVIGARVLGEQGMKLGKKAHASSSEWLKKKAPEKLDAAVVKENLSKDLEKGVVLEKKEDSAEYLKTLESIFANYQASQKREARKENWSKAAQATGAIVLGGGISIGIGHFLESYATSAVESAVGSKPSISNIETASAKPSISPEVSDQTTSSSPEVKPKISQENLEAAKELAEVKKGEGVWHSVERQVRDHITSGKKLNLSSLETPPTDPQELERFIDRATARIITAEGLSNTGIRSPGEVVSWNPESNHLSFSSGKEDALYDFKTNKPVNLDELPKDTHVDEKVASGIKNASDAPGAKIGSGDTSSVDKAVMVGRRAVEATDSLTEKLGQTDEDPLNFFSEQDADPIMTTVESWKKGLTPEQITSAEKFIKGLDATYGVNLSEAIGSMNLKEFMGKINPGTDLRASGVIEMIDPSDATKTIKIQLNPGSRLLRYAMDADGNWKPSANDLEGNVSDFFKKRAAGTSVRNFNVPLSEEEVKIFKPSQTIESTQTTKSPIPIETKPTPVQETPQTVKQDDIIPTEKEIEPKDPLQKEESWKTAKEDTEKIIKKPSLAATPKVTVTPSPPPPPPTNN